MQDLSYRYLTDPQQIRSHIEWLNRNTNYVVCDTETTHKNPHKAELVDVQISGKHDKEVVIFPAQYAENLKLISVRMVWQNFKYDLIVLARHGVDLRDKEHWDTMLVEHLLDENMYNYNLPTLIEKHAGMDVGYKGDFWSKYASYLDAPFEERMQYGAQDIYWTGFVYRSQQLMIREGAL